ncbi:helix-turn-helix domain-containing protein [Bacillus sp. SM2101]|uniref:helix-turn-helix transcriptional regulator n=1 Tax=Bacillus sp. SM2101 TaxID=2805366 RepID=UPI001BDF0BDB|nr:helix-turn-helix domain-containing protein [Bacillus sp. SM2101]
MKYSFNSKKELIEFIQDEILTTPEAIEYLGISKQALNKAVFHGKVTPVKEVPRIKLFLKSDLDVRRKEAEELRKKYRPYDDKNGEFPIQH